MLMNTTNPTTPDLSALADRYGRDAMPAGGSGADQEDAEFRRMHEVDLAIMEVIYQAAMQRAQSKGQKVRAVARAILFQAAASAKPDPEFAADDESKRPPLREYVEPGTRIRLRFKLPLADWQAARTAVMKSGRSVSAVVEKGLAHYARTGKIEP